MLAQTRSTQGGQSVSMSFVNNTGTKVQVLWLDFSGNRKLYAAIEPNGRYSVNTNSNHPWLVRDLEGACRAVVVPKANVPQVAIR